MGILIIGGAGYIGSRLADFLSPKFEIHSVDLEWFYSRTDNLKIDYSKLTKDYLSQFQTVILLAAHSSVQMCIKDRASSFENNVANFVRLLDKLDRQKFIYASSSSVYTTTQGSLADETNDRIDPQNYYDLGKQEIDFYASLSNLEYYGLRFGTVNGYSPNLRTDIMLNKMCDCAINNHRIEIFNSKIHRPILGILDLCRAVERIIEGPDRRGIYNLASFNQTIGEIAASAKLFFAQKGLEIDLIDKGSAETYDFCISSDKFCQTYQFGFEETPQTILESMFENWSTCQKSIRIERPYVQAD